MPMYGLSFATCIGMNWHLMCDQLIARHTHNQTSENLTYILTRFGCFLSHLCTIVFGSVTV